MAKVFKCSDCGEDCTPKGEYGLPEIVFRNKDTVICENCSIDYEQIGDEIRKREV